MAAAVENLGSIFADPAAYADPVALARRGRSASGRSHRSCGWRMPGFPEFWAITKHADVMEIERHPDLFTNAPVPTLAPQERVATMDRDAGEDADPDGRRRSTRRTATSSTTGSSPANVKKMQDRDRRAGASSPSTDGGAGRASATS